MFGNLAFFFFSVIYQELKKIFFWFCFNFIINFKVCLKITNTFTIIIIIIKKKKAKVIF